ncbi:HdeD family acid-resistance protein [Dactylosporangium sp. McL0621]|uniref:HdeD family acid-resistance protein n=1 Tax=Dactylosporangium sp. McL0621 TaxID=3415678 RepID=UPI003CFB29FB
MASMSGHAQHPAAATVRRDVEVPFWRLVGVGVATALFGVAVLAWPHATLRLLGVLAGVWLLVIGAMRIAGAFRRRPATARHVSVQQVVDGLFGVLLLAVGIASLSSARAGVVTVSVLIGLAWLLSGFAAVLLGLFASGGARTSLLALGGAAIVVGVLFVAWPGVSLRVLVLLTGISAVVLGAVEIAIAVQARRSAAAPIEKSTV